MPQENYKDKIPVDVSLMNGKWLVYRRQAEPGAADQDALIKSFSINNAPSANTGEVTFYTSDKTITQPAQFYFQDGTLKIATSGYNWTFNTYKANGKEFVFGWVGQLLYYAKNE